jgi:hypothetical protein
MKLVSNCAKLAIVLYGTMLSFMVTRLLYELSNEVESLTDLFFFTTITLFLGLLIGCASTLIYKEVSKIKN